MDTVTTIRSLWEQIAAHDWHGLGTLLAEDIRVSWPASNEVISGRQNFVAVQSEYPQGWSIHLLDAVAAGDRGATEVEVPFVTGERFRVTSWWTVTDGLITAGTEYWITIGQDPIPQWRRRYSTPEA